VFELGKVYRRRDLHASFGGQQQGGIVTPAEHPIILLITGEAGRPSGQKQGDPTLSHTTLDASPTVGPTTRPR
jgi:5-methylcytosine-specific restriction protein A